MERRTVAENGFSLPETLIALLILAIVSLAIIGMFTHSVQLNASGLDYTALTNVAKDTAEGLVALPFEDPQLLAAGSPYTLPSIDDPPLDVTYSVEDYVVNATDFDPATVFAGTTAAVGTENLKVITVTVASSRAGILGRRDVTVRTVKASG